MYQKSKYAVSMPTVRRCLFRRRSYGTARISKFRFEILFAANTQRIAKPEKESNLKCILKLFDCGFMSGRLVFIAHMCIAPFLPVVCLTALTAQLIGTDVLLILCLKTLKDAQTLFTVCRRDWLCSVVFLHVAVLHITADSVNCFVADLKAPIHELPGNGQAPLGIRPRKGAASTQ